MAVGSKIEWTEATWNPVTGCSRVSPGCRHCYAERMARRLKAMGQPNYRNGFDVTLQPHMLELPLRWRKSRTVFVNSMSDLFHEDVPFAYIQRVFDTMVRASQHRFQVLTKRSARLAELAPRLQLSPNIWIGVSVENDRFAGRIDDLRTVDASIRFLSLEPLLGPLRRLNLEGIQWVVVGGESGPGARPMKSEWVKQIRDHCLASDVAFFFKQWGGTNKKRNGRMLDHRTWDELPKRMAV